MGSISAGNRIRMCGASPWDCHPDCMERNAPIQFSGKTILMVIVGVAGALALGVGMCFSMVWENMILGIVIGVIGIAVLLCLIPLAKGIRE